MEYQKIPMDDYIDMLEERRTKVYYSFKWDIEDCIWDYCLEMIRECGVSPDKSKPMYVVDNLIVNGDYGEFDAYKEEGETDEEFIAREEDNCLAIFPEERMILYSF